MFDVSSFLCCLCIQEYRLPPVWGSVIINTSPGPELTPEDVIIEIVTRGAMQMPTVFFIHNVFLLEISCSIKWWGWTSSRFPQNPAHAPALADLGGLVQWFLGQSS